jgi:hypothetical protein
MNAPANWMIPYLDEFKNLKASHKKAKAILHTFADGKRAYLEPLFVQPMCLTCHGAAVDGQLNKIILARYPHDQAIGFKAGDFRGFIWVREN